ncbi:MAG: DUF4912 domain-containing protein [Halarcobacter sp.]
MNPNTNELVKSSMELENSFSSSSHVIDTLVSEGEPPATIYSIPDRYNKDTLRVLLVNTKKYYVYWEISDKTLEEQGLDLNKDKLYFKVSSKDGAELFEFTSSFALGEYFIKLQFENMKIVVSVGKKVDDKFEELFNSNKVHTFSSKMNLPSKEDELWAKRNLSWTEIVRSTMKEAVLGTSSAEQVKELERLRHFTQMEEEKLSSSTIHKGIKND